jgi:hypothetical protein
MIVTGICGWLPSALEPDREKCAAVFRKDHAQSRTKSAMRMAAAAAGGLPSLGSNAVGCRPKSSSLPFRFSFDVFNLGSTLRMIGIWGKARSAN